MHGKRRGVDHRLQGQAFPCGVFTKTYAPGRVPGVEPPVISPYLRAQQGVVLRRGTTHEDAKGGEENTSPGVP